MGREHIDFKMIRASVTITEVLDHYGRNWLKATDEGLCLGRCPIHEGSDESFEVRTGTARFKCRGCGRHGNVLQLVAAIERCTIRKAATLIRGWKLHS